MKRVMSYTCVDVCALDNQNACDARNTQFIHPDKEKNLHHLTFALIHLVSTSIQSNLFVFTLHKNVKVTLSPTGIA